jgi:hypothetical protein
MEDRITAAAGARGRLRASDSDRERVLDILKTAFAQGRLSKDEFDVRVGQTLASRTWGDLTTQTSDIPAWPLPQPVRKPVRTPPSPPGNAFIKAVACAIIALAAITMAGIPGMWTMPAPPSLTAQACQIFDSWRNPTYSNSHIPNLSTAVQIVRSSDPYLAADLSTLQQASLRYQDFGGKPQSAAARQFEQTQVQADTNHVSADCLADGY